MREVSLYLSSPFNGVLPSDFDEVKCPEGATYTGTLQKKKTELLLLPGAVVFSEKAFHPEAHAGRSLDLATRAVSYFILLFLYLYF